MAKPNRRLAYGALLRGTLSGPAKPTGHYQPNSAIFRILPIIRVAIMSRVYWNERVYIRDEITCDKF
jgi:hypothetical protein